MGAAWGREDPVAPHLQADRACKALPGPYGTCMDCWARHGALKAEVLFQEQGQVPWRGWQGEGNPDHPTETRLPQCTKNRLRLLSLGVKPCLVEAAQPW